MAEIKVNTAAILKKAKAFLKSNEGQQREQAVVDNYMLNGGALEGGSNIKSMTHAGDAFIEVLDKTISGTPAYLGSTYGSGGGGLGPTAIEAIRQIDHTGPTKEGKYKYKVDVNFTGEKHRESLEPEKYGGVDNIIKLLNSGYSAKGKVSGVWHGDEISSLQYRSGAHFIEQSVASFKGRAAEFGIKNIQISDEYS